MSASAIFVNGTFKYEVVTQMSRLSVRLFLAAVVILAGQLSVMWVRAGYTFTVVKPSKDISQLPVEFGTWRGKEHALDPQVAQFLNADSQVSRMYDDAAGTQIAMHAAIWTQNVEDDVAPHHPNICYPNAGWTIRQVQNIEIESPVGVLPISLCLMERSGESIVTCHWYQMGNERFLDRTGGRSVHRNLWGSSEWPAIVKVLLHTPAVDIATARPKLEEMALDIFAWTHDIN